MSDQGILRSGQSGQGVLRSGQGVLRSGQLAVVRVFLKAATSFLSVRAALPSLVSLPVRP